MESKALMVKLEALPGKGEQVATFLREALEPVGNEADTRAWYALRFGETAFAIFDTFDGQVGRLNHLLGKVGRSLAAKTFTHLSGLPSILRADVLAIRSPDAQALPGTAIYTSFREAPKRARALRTTLAAPDWQDGDQPGVAAWYALQFGGGNFATLEFRPHAADRARQAIIAAMAERHAGMIAPRSIDTQVAEVLESKRP